MLQWERCRTLYLTTGRGCITYLCREKPPHAYRQRKTYISNAFGMTACRAFYTVKYIRLPELLGELAVARGEGRYAKAVKPYKQVNLLVIDERLLFPLSMSDSRDLLDIISARHKRASTIFCSQFAPEGWHDKIDDPVVADAICDRIVYDSYKILIQGDGIRKCKGISE